MLVPKLEYPMGDVSFIARCVVVALLLLNLAMPWSNVEQPPHTPLPQGPAPFVLAIP